MSIYSSSSPNVSLPPSSLSSYLNWYSFLHNCYASKVGTVTTTAFTISSILFLLPLYILILYLGLQKWRQQGSNSTMSHSDLFTYNMILIELFSVSGSILTCCGVHTDHPQLVMMGVYLSIINLSGQMFFHVLTCVERYLAVVHPITYLSLRKAKGIRFRSITIGCVWLLCYGGTGILYVKDKFSIVILTIFFLAMGFTVISFCSLSVLFVLIRPGPGEEGGSRQRVDQSKLRVFYTILFILGVLLIRFGGNILVTAGFASVELGESERCSLYSSLNWLSIPSSLVLPLLFLHRAGKLPCWKKNK